MNELLRDKPVYRKLVMNAYDLFPDDTVHQMKYIEENAPTPQYYLLAICEAAQREVNNRKNNLRNMIVPSGDVDYLLRGLSEAINHLNPDLPTEVFKSIGRIVQFVEKTLDFENNSKSRF